MVHLGATPSERAPYRGRYHVHARRHDEAVRIPGRGATGRRHRPAVHQPWFGGVLETFGGGLLLLGLFTRPVAFILSGEMAVAYFQFHFPKGFWPTMNGGMPAVLYCFLWFYFSAAGAGPWSLDAKRWK